MVVESKIKSFPKDTFSIRLTDKRGLKCSINLEIEVLEQFIAAVAQAIARCALCKGRLHAQLVELALKPHLSRPEIGLRKNVNLFRTKNETSTKKQTWKSGD